MVPHVSLILVLTIQYVADACICVPVYIILNLPGLFTELYLSDRLCLVLTN